MIKAILFDLNGTLIDNPMDAFIPAYFRALVKKVAPLVPPQKFIEQLQLSTRQMMQNNDPARTNAEVFAADFFPKLGIPREQLLPLLDDFYARDYRALREYIQPVPMARVVVARAFEGQRAVVIATQPVFPRTAIVQRIEWGGVDEFDYALITDSETMHACKPNPNYFREIATRIGIEPRECVMVGNDAQADIAGARSAGMKTYWIADARESPSQVASDWRGSLSEFGDLVARGLD